MNDEFLSDLSEWEGDYTDKINHWYHEEGSLSIRAFPPNHHTNPLIEEDVWVVEIWPVGAWPFLGDTDIYRWHMDSEECAARTVKGLMFYCSKCRTTNRKD